MGCPSSPYPCPQCNSQNRYPAGCGAFCIPVNPTQPYVCCCPGVWPTPYGPLPDCCVATCVKYDCAPIIPGISCPPYDLDFTPSHCFALNSRCDTTGPNPLQDNVDEILDPPLGFPLEKVGIENLAESELPILLVVLGRCEGCNERVVYEWVEMGKWETLSKAVRFVLVLQEGVKKVDEIGRDAKGVSLVADEGGEIARRLNAFFVPRAYGFEGGKLVWVQREGNLGEVEILERFFEAVKGREKAWLLINAWSREMREKAWGKSLVNLEKGVDKR